MRTFNFAKPTYAIPVLFATIAIAASVASTLVASAAYGSEAVRTGGAAALGGTSAPTEAEQTEAGGGEAGAEGVAPGIEAETPGPETEAETEATLDGITFATWYGPGLFGRHTACGQMLTRKTIGVANRTLPCGTLVKVSYEGRHRTIPVIDRGPYGSLGASWDLTEAAARQLHITESVDIRTKVVGHVKNSPELGLAASVRRRRKRHEHGSTGGASA